MKNAEKSGIEIMQEIINCRYAIYGNPQTLSLWVFLSDSCGILTLINDKGGSGIVPD